MDTATKPTTRWALYLSAAGVQGIDLYPTERAAVLALLDGVRHMGEMLIDERKTAQYDTDDLRIYVEEYAVDCGADFYLTEVQP
jgi:hypothetical protein